MTRVEIELEEQDGETDLRLVHSGFETGDERRSRDGLVDLLRSACQPPGELR